MTDTETRILSILQEKMPLTRREQAVEAARAIIDTVRAESMIEYILDIDWMTTTEFCKHYEVPPPTAIEGVEGLFRIDAVKHKMFLDYAKKLNKEKS